ncbi:MAG: SCP2 sterol-binding domain-containing protein [Actinomycetota bacterium]|nr:SCP2 sterol-binding domain-containing protein [Acidimicrobiia bacterium]MDQ3293652.1 SCP2 sterol-binding domain-containing protein [Actinomycetota bacterium]
MTDEFDVRAQVAESIKDRTDEEILAFVEGLGAEVVLEQAFGEMQRRFRPEAAGNESAVIQWDIAAPDKAFAYQVTVNDGTCSYVKGSKAPARITLALNLQDFLRFVSGVLEPLDAFMTGRLRMTGDLLMSQAMQSWFEDVEQP